MAEAAPRGPRGLPARPSPICRRFTLLPAACAAPKAGGRPAGGAGAGAAQPGGPDAGAGRGSCGQQLCPWRSGVGSETKQQHQGPAATARPQAACLACARVAPTPILPDAFSARRPGRPTCRRTSPAARCPTRRRCAALSPLHCKPPNALSLRGRRPEVAAGPLAPINVHVAAPPPRPQLLQDVDLPTYARMVCGVLDLSPTAAAGGGGAGARPAAGSDAGARALVHSLHALFSLYLEVRGAWGWGRAEWKCARLQQREAESWRLRQPALLGCAAKVPLLPALFHPTHLPPFHRSSSTTRPSQACSAAARWWRRRSDADGSRSGCPLAERSCNRAWTFSL